MRYEAWALSREYAGGGLTVNTYQYCRVNSPVGLQHSAPGLQHCPCRITAFFPLHCWGLQYAWLLTKTCIRYVNNYIGNYTVHTNPVSRIFTSQSAHTIYIKKINRNNHLYQEYSLLTSLYQEYSLLTSLYQEYSLLTSLYQENSLLTSLYEEYSLLTSL